MIPESLGGTLESDIQCSTCNNYRLGSALISHAKENYPVRLAVNYLKNELPELFNSIENRQTYTGRDQSGQVGTLVFRNNKLITKVSKKEDGSIIYDESESEKHLRKILAKQGLEKLEIEKTLLNIRSSPLNEWLRLPSKGAVKRFRYDDVYQIPGRTEMDDRIVVLIAYNYLCLLLGKLVFNDRLQFIREFILSGTLTEQISIDQQFYTNEYQPFHRIHYEASDVSITIKILLFGSIHHVVTFWGMTTYRSNKILIEDLKYKRIVFAETFEEAEREGFFTNKLE
jgi:hypothetical protein